MKKIVSLILILVLLFSVSACSKKDDYSEMLSKAEAYANSGDYANAIAGYRVAQKLNPEKERAFLGEADVHLLLEDCASAADAVNKALEISPNSADAWALKCKVDICENDVSAFEQDTAYAEVCNADLKDLYASAASMYASAGEYENAIAYFEKTELSSLDDAQKEQYKKALVRNGQKETAVSLGLQTQNALDAAFESGNLVLEESEFPEINAEDFEIADEVWAYTDTEKPEDVTAALADELADYQAEWISLSPSGNSGILNIICYYNGKYHIIYPSSARSVEDIYGNLEKFYALMPKYFSQGMVYSPNGRYAAVADNYSRAVNGGNLLYDPIIIDLSTGELILTATYSSEWNSQVHGVVTTSTFSADGRYFYYILCGTTTEYDTALYRYDLELGTTELCYSGSDYTAYPRLIETDNGSLLILRTAENTTNPCGVTRISYENGAWTSTEFTFDLPTKYHRATYLDYSANSGYAYIADRTLYSSFFFQCISPNDAFSGMNRYLGISEEDNRIHALTADEVTAVLEASTDADAFPFMLIESAAFSPDGNYLLLCATDWESHVFYLVRLEDFSVKEIQGTESIQVYTSIEWNTDTLIIPNSNGTHTAYQFRFR